MPHHHCDDGSGVSAVCGCSQQPGPAKGTMERVSIYAQHFASADPQDDGTRGYQIEKMLQVTRQSWACKRGEQYLLCHHCSSTSSLISPHSLQMPGKTEFQQDILTSLYLCSEAKHNSATKACTKPCKWPCGSSRRVFCAKVPFLISKHFSFNNKEGLMPAVWLFFIGLHVNFAHIWSDPWEKGEYFFFRFYDFIKICSKESYVMLRLIVLQMSVTGDKSVCSVFMMI